VGYANHFTIVETWANLSAYDAHVSDPSVREFHNQLNPLLGSPHDERIYRDVSEKNP
jgi:quinol monooxygenase YgiN